MKRLLLLCSACLFSLGAVAGPQINVGVVYDYLSGDKSTYMKRVFNGGTSTAFVKVNILEMIYDDEGTTAKYRSRISSTAAPVTA